MSIRRFVTLAAVAALALLALGSSSASASTQLRLDPGSILSGATTITNTSSSPATLSTNGGEVTCQNTTFDADVASGSSATTISGQLTSLTFTTCTDQHVLLNFTSCHRHGTPLPAISVNGSTGTVTLTDVIVRCVIQSSNQVCYYTAATATGSANNALSTLTHTNIPVTGISAPTTDALPPGACGTSGNFSFQLRHIVQGGTNRTMTVLP
jgi:hypothetical protein